LKRIHRRPALPRGRYEKDKKCRPAVSKLSVLRQLGNYFPAHFVPKLSHFAGSARHGLRNAPRPFYPAAGQGGFQFIYTRLIAALQAAGVFAFETQG
jgi:hypothetical protein